MTKRQRSEPAQSGAADSLFGDLPFNNLMDPRAAHDCALALQEKIDASAFAVDGVNFWMLVRQFLFLQSARQAGSTFASLFGAGGHSGRVFDATDVPPEKVLRDVHVLTAEQTSLIGTKEIDLEAHRGSLLFIEVPGDYTQHFNDYAVNSYADPVLRHFRAKGETVLKLCRYQRRLLARSKLEPPLYFTPAAAGLHKHQRDLARVRETIEAANRALAGLGLSHRIEARTIFADIASILSARNAARKFLELLEPEMIFVQNFSNTEKMGVIAAAREAGIPSIDLMHGIQDRNNIYHDHPDVGSEQIYLYPDSLWVWGDVTNRALAEKTGEPGAKWRHVAKSGYAWSAAHSDWIKDPRIDNLKRLLPADRRIVLYCHDASLHDDAFEGFLPDSVLSAIRASRDDLFWLIRMHPRSFHLLGSVADYLRSLGLSNFEILLSSECNLYDLFDLCSVVLVKYSVVGLEAASQGLPVITHHAVGARTFERQIATGHIAWARTSEDILTLARTLCAPAKPLRYVENAPRLLDGALDETRQFFRTRRRKGASA